MIASDRLPASTTGPVAAPPAVYTSLDLRIESNSRQTARARGYMTRANAIARFYDSILGDIPYDSFTMALTEHTSPGGHSPGYFAVLNQTLPGTPLTWRNDPASFETTRSSFWRTRSRISGGARRSAGATITSSG